MLEAKLQNFVKYCLDYIKLTERKYFEIQIRNAFKLPNKIFDFKKFISQEDEEKEIVNLQIFYNYSALNVPNDLKNTYEEEREIAKKLEDIYNKVKNDPFTKQGIVNFGYYEIFIPNLEDNISEIEIQEEYLLTDSNNDSNTKHSQINYFPLFSIPIKILKENDQYYINRSENIEVNLSFLSKILKQENYYNLINEINEEELSENLILPIKDFEVFNKIWNKVKTYLKLSDINFNENSFKIDEVSVSLSTKTKHFIIDDLERMSQKEEDELKKTSLLIWSADNIDFDYEENEQINEGELFFPLIYDNYQLKAVSFLKYPAFVIQGPPGTGKSQTISNLLCHLRAKGKKILFVSQKDQAIKVVKNILKNKIKVNYFYAYFPDKLSPYTDEEDERDSIALQLTALDSYIQSKFSNTYIQSKIKDRQIGYMKDITEIVDDLNNIKENYNKLINQEREYSILHMELETMKDYLFTIKDINKFQENFNADVYKNLEKILTELKEIETKNKNYNKNQSKNNLDEIFLEIIKNIDPKDKYSLSINEIASKIENGWFYGGSNVIVRKILVFFMFSIRFLPILQNLPIKVVDHLIGIFEKERNKNKVIKTLREIANYFEYYENKKMYELLYEKFLNTLDSCGLDEQTFLNMESFLRNDDFNNIKDKIIKANELQEKLNHLRNLIKNENLNELNEKIKEKEKEKSEWIRIYLQNIIDENLIEKYKTQKIRRILRTFSLAAKKTKKAYKTFEKIKNDKELIFSITELFPIWIMKLEDVSRILPLEPNIFDYVIFDESSQCNIAYALPAMYRAKNVIFVGDSLQMRDDSILFKSNTALEEIARKNKIPENLQIKRKEEPVKSVLDMAYQMGFPEIVLRNHYRSVKELIGFSNENFYKPRGKELFVKNINYFPYKNTNRIMLIHRVFVDPSKEKSSKINVSEAEAILNFFEDLKKDENYKDKSIGILTFFNEQASYLRKIFEEKGFKEEKDNYQISIIEGIQGDEKDIVIYSFVIKDTNEKNRYLPLTGEGGDVRKEINEGRVNVAFSRARLQVHCFVSLDVNDFPDGIWIKKYLRYVENYGKINFYLSELKNFDSKFEEDFYYFLVNNLPQNQFIIKNQVESCGYRIDFVLIDPKTGKKLAIECDGPTHFDENTWGERTERDEERQRILESAGWNFLRIRYSDWYDDNFNKKVIIEEINEYFKS
jgi:superfamily I DNA and/or RNA helicase/very-short-patch-repair endonuclease